MQRVLALEQEDEEPMERQRRVVLAQPVLRLRRFEAVAYDAPEPEVEGPPTVHAMLPRHLLVAQQGGVEHSLDRVAELLADAKLQGVPRRLERVVMQVQQQAVPGLRPELEQPLHPLLDVPERVLERRRKEPLLPPHVERAPLQAEEPVRRRVLGEHHGL